MSNLFQGISSGLAQLKNFYEGPIVTQFSDDVPVYRAAEKDKKSWSGYQVIRPLKVRRNVGIGAVSDGGNLPNVSRQTTTQATISAKFNYLRFGITGPMIKASSSDIGSFVRSASYELEEGYKDLTTDVNRQFGWDGTGTLATVGTSATGAFTISITGRESVEPALRFLEVGMAVDIYDSTATTASASNVNITAITGSPTALTATVTFDTAVSVTATDIIIRAGSNGNEIQGLLYALDGAATSIYGVNRTTYPSYRGNVTAVSGQLTLDTMQNVWNEGLRRGGAKYNAGYCDYNALRFYQKLLTADKRYVNTVEGDGGFAKKGEFYLDFNGVPMTPDKDLAQRIMFLPAEAFKNYVLAELEFADETGSMYIAQTGVDALEVRIRFFANLFNEKPAACAVLTSFTSP
jgi:hypothetical protein